DPIAAPFFDMLGKQPCRDIHSAAGRIDYRELDRAGWKILGLELGEISLHITALGHGWGRQQSGKGNGKKCKSDCRVSHRVCSLGMGSRRNIKAMSPALHKSISAVAGRWMKIIAPCGDMANDWRNDCSSNGASTNAMINGARSYCSLCST